MGKTRESTIWNRGFQLWTLPLSKEVWQFTLFAIGHDRWTYDNEDHQEPEWITWYIQILFWQISWTRELVEDDDEQ